MSRSGARVGQAKPVNHVIEPRFQKLQQRFSSHAAFAQRILKDTPELALEQTVLITQLLFLAQGNGVIGLFAASAPRAVHARRVTFSIQRFGRSEKRHAVTPAYFGFWSCVSAHEVC